MIFKDNPSLNLNLLLEHHDNFSADQWQLRSLPALNSKKSLIGLAQENDCKITGQLF